MLSGLSRILPLLAAAALVSTVRAQWVTFQNQTSTRLVAPAAVGANDLKEKDYAWADFDHDGDIDMVSVRKEPWTVAGGFPNVLLMNENGVLTDRTATLASASLVPGSSGFLDDTNDRDVVAADVNGDGWEDLVTATTLSFGQPQYIRVPRVYLNRGLDLNGNWLGFLFDDISRIDDIASGWNGEQRFCSVSAGDVNGDGFIDLYFGDYQQGGTRLIDVNDRLMINDGTGHFTDQSATRMTVVMLESSFAMATDIRDMNGDGKLDILKDDALNAPQGISVSYNNPANEGFFNNYQVIYNNSPYHFALGDLNNDNLPDMVVSDDSADRYILHTGVQGGQATFSPTMVFSYTGGGFDDGFGGNNLIIDLNNDGWRDVIITDVDVDIPDCGRRTHIFHNLGNSPNVTLQEEQVSGAVCGIPTALLAGSHDVAVFDINGDGWNDMVLGRCSGTEVWINQPPLGMAITYPNGQPAFIPPGSTGNSLDVLATGTGGQVAAPGSGVFHYSINGGAQQTVPMADLGPGLFRASLPVLPNCTDQLRYFVTLQSTSGANYSDPPTAPAAQHLTISAAGYSIVYEEGFEGTVTGWTVNNTAVTGGAWEVAVPNPTISGGQLAAPATDAEAGAATHCWVTGNGPASGVSSPGLADLDGGPTDLISPPFDLAGSDANISYSRWFYNDNGTGGDALEVAVSPNGVTWTNVEVVAGPGQNQWAARTFRVGQYITPSNAVRVRFRCSDNPNNSITEAGVDAFRVEAYSCEVCQQSVGLQGPGTAVLSMCGGDLSTGTAADIVLSNAPATTNGLFIASGFLNPSPWNGGTLIDGAPFLFLPFFTDGAGTFAIPGFPGGLGGFWIYAQCVYIDAALPLGVGISNGIRIQFRP